MIMSGAATPTKKLSFYLFAAFFVLGGTLGIFAVLKKDSLPHGMLRLGGLLYFGLFFVTISLAEIYCGEIRTRLSGPPTCSREESPLQFWIQVGGQIALGIFLLAAIIWSK
ncbi:MAG TPA: hypothetical protein VG734_07550 [Lacunisphaera sp.]|nr:hypothetical protein [Lacunisphaera sp.]